MARVKSPDQVKRLDGRNCFVELLTSGLKWDKLCLNFMSYNKEAATGNRTTGSICTFVDIPQAEMFCEQVLSGKMAKLGQKAKANAAAKGYKYAPAIWTIVAGTPASRSNRADGMAASRQIKLTPGAKTDWVFSAESGPGREEGTGIIAPAYNNGRPECIIRIPISDEQLAGLALSINSVIHLWYRQKYLPEIILPRTADVLVVGKEEKMILSTDSLDIERLRVGVGDVDFYLTDTKAAVLGNDILNTRILKLGKDNHDRVYEAFGGGKQAKGGVKCRVLAINSTPDGFWNVTTEFGPGKLGDDGSVLPDWDKPKASKTAILTREELLQFGFALKNLSQAWAEARYMSIIEKPIAEAREEADQKLKELRKTIPVDTEE